MGIDGYITDKERIAYNLNLLLIKAKRENKESASSIAKKLGIDKMQLSNWRKGKIMPNNENLKKLADYFKIDISNLFNGYDPANPLANNDYLSETQSVKKSRNLKSNNLINNLPYGIQKIIEACIKIKKDKLYRLYDLYNYACAQADIDDNEKEDQKRFLSKDIADRMSLGLMNESDKEQYNNCINSETNRI